MGQGGRKGPGSKPGPRGHKSQLTAWRVEGTRGKKEKNSARARGHGDGTQPKGDRLWEGGGTGSKKRSPSSQWDIP